MAMTRDEAFEVLDRMAQGIAQMFGSSCETLINDMKDPKHPVLAIYNGHVSGREIGSTLDVLGTARALEMIMCNTPIDGATALQWGLANRCAEEGTLAEVTYAFAAKLAKGPTYTYGKQKELMNKYLYGDLPAYSEDEVYLLSHCSETPDFAEAVGAFLEKRAEKHFVNK